MTFASLLEPLRMQRKQSMLPSLKHDLTVRTHEDKVLVIGKNAATYGSNLHIIIRDTELEVSLSSST